MPYYPKRRTYRKKRTYKRKSMPKRRYNKRRRTYRKKGSVDKGTYLKVSSSALPVVINNKATPDQGQELTADTYQCALTFRMGSSADGETVVINNQIKPEVGSSEVELQQNDVFIGTSDLLSKYTNLYKYVQIYKIVVKFTPTITEGGVLSQTPGSYFTNAISGSVTTDFDQGDFQSPYTVNYPPTVEGNAKANSRKVSREHNLLRSWTRTFVPKQVIQSVVPNPKAKYQYKPEIELQTFPNPATFDDIRLSQSKLIIRMRKPQLAGFTASSIEGTETEYPDAGTYVRYGTLNVHAYLKFKSPLF